MIDYASFDEVVNIPNKQKIGLLNVKFDFTQGSSGEGIDMVYKWVLPLTVVKDEAYDYKAHPRKGYAKALLRILPFNDYSGDYSGTSLKFFSTGDEANATVFNTARGYVVDEKTIFFYAGNVTEQRTDRKNYKIYFHFNGDREGTVDIYTDNPLIKLEVLKDASFRIIERMDEVQPYLKNRYLIINNINYNYVDYSSIPGSELEYSVNGSLTLLRKINTQIPDEDQAIEW